MKTYIIIYKKDSIFQTLVLESIDIIDAIHMAVYQLNLHRTLITSITEITK